MMQCYFNLSRNSGGQKCYNTDGYFTKDLNNSHPASAPCEAKHQLLQAATATLFFNDGSESFTLEDASR